ncbi:MAG: ankyrin repeat domain-containing protein [Desulfocapsaceae bacterium]|nr:ankyrin repeat domain-containing protein [Desulfocapsaceae bacterium]
MKCPKCTHIQQGTVECESCGIIFAKYYAHLLKKKFNQAVQKYHAQEFEAALKIFNAIVGANTPKDKEIVSECKKFILLIQADPKQKNIPVRAVNIGQSDRDDQETEKARPAKKIIRFNPILSTNLAVVFIIFLSWGVGGIVSGFLDGGTADGVGWLFVFLIMVLGNPWEFLGHHFYSGSIAPSYFVNVLMIGTPVFLNATLAGCAVELFIRVKAHYQGEALRVWSRKEFLGTWLVILAVFSSIGYINFWYYESSLAWRKANPEAAYRLSHPEAQRKYVEEMRQRSTEQRLRQKQEAIQQRVQAPQNTNDSSQNANPQKEETPLVPPQPPQSDHTADWFQAVSIGNSNTVNALLAEGVDVNAKTRFSETALILASQNGHKYIVEMLLNRGADVNAQELGGDTALIMASRCGHKDIVEMLLDRGADVNAKANGGETALMAASHYGDKDIVKAILDKEADVNAKMQMSGHTALIWAILDGHQDIAALLRKYGANK